MKTKKRKTTEKTVVNKYFTLSHLIYCSTVGLKWRYNRQVSEKVAALPNVNYPIYGTMVHRHRRGVPCDPHMRCVVVGPLRPGLREYTAEDIGLIAVIDVPMAYYDALPMYRVPPHLATRRLAV